MAKRAPRQRAVWASIIAVNAEPWEPLRGMVKRRCADCGLLYAKPAGSEGEVCQDCELWRLTQRRRC